MDFPEHIEVFIFVLILLFVLLQVRINILRRKELNTIKDTLSTLSSSLNKTEVYATLANDRLDVWKKILFPTAEKPPKMRSIVSFNHEDYSIEELLAPVYNSLTTGSRMTSGNFAFTLLCDKLGVDEDDLIFNPDWHHKNPVPDFSEDSENEQS